MNKVLFTGNVLLLGIVIVLSGFLWSPSGHRSAPLPPPEYKSCYDCGKDTFYGITLEEFMTGIARYKTTHSARVDKQPYMAGHGLTDARACWFSLDTLEKYICLIKKYSANLGLPSSQLGVRFYYAVYPSHPYDVWDPKYISRHTLFMVPTRADQTVGTVNANVDVNIDFDPRVGTFPLANYFSGDHKKRIMALDLGGGGRDPEMAKNQGQLCPPNCPPDAANSLSGIDQVFPNVTYMQ